MLRLSARVDELTRLYPPGSPCWYWPGTLNDAPQRSMTRSPWAVVCEQIVVWVRGRADCIAHDHVQTIDPGKARDWNRIGAAVCLVDWPTRRVLMNLRSDQAAHA